MTAPGESEMWPEAAGEFLHNMLGGTEPEPGPPYVHTIAPPQPAVLTRSGKLLYQPPRIPWFTVARAVQSVAPFLAAVDWLHTDPGVSRDELDPLAEGILSLADGGSG